MATDVVIAAGDVVVVEVFGTINDVVLVVVVVTGVVLEAQALVLFGWQMMF